jgi:hypothetical protein
MKAEQRNRGLISVLALVLALGGCANFLGRSGPEGQGQVRIYLSPGEADPAFPRTLVPAAADFRYTLIFSKEGETLVVKDFSSGASQALDPGNWTVTAQGNWEGNSNADIVIAEGSGAVTVAADTLSLPLTIFLRPRQGGGNGTFEYNIVFDDPGIGEAWLRLVPVNSSSEFHEVKLRGSNSSGSAGTLKAAPGYYRLTLTALKGGQTAGRTEAVQIYSYVSTSKTHNFGTGDFAAHVYLGGTVSLDLGRYPGYTLEKVHVWNTADHSWPSAASAPITNVSTGTSLTGIWELLTGPSVEDRYYLKMELKKAGLSYYSAILDRNIGVEGNGNLSLAATAYGLGIQEGPGGSLSADVSQAFEGETVTLTARASRGYVTEAPVINGGAVSPGGSGSVFTFAMPSGGADIQSLFSPPVAGRMIGYPTSGGGIDTGDNDASLLRTAYVPGAILFPRGADDGSRGIVENSYWIGETEVTYELWSVVRTWAVTGSGAPGAGQYILTDTVTAVNDSYPASWGSPWSGLTWHDMVAWCNALTEWYNAHNGTDEDLELVYYADPGYTVPIRSGELTAFYPDAVAPAGRSALIKPGANGFRLPTDQEWELAARWQGTVPANSNWVELGGYYFTKGNSASGAASSSVEDRDLVVVSGTAEVKTKQPNALGLYDVSGNGTEAYFGGRRMVHYNLELHYQGIGLGGSGSSSNWRIGDNYSYGMSSIRLARTARE